MASDFQRTKVATVFSAMDVDTDGFLEESDFKALTTRWITLRGCEPGSADHARLTTIMMGWWATLLAASDRNRDDKVSLDELMGVVDQLPTMIGAVTATATAIFEAIDADADGWISPAEYRQLIETWNGRPADTDEVFPLLDQNGDGRLVKEEFIDLWTQFWVGDDPDAAGTWVFGTLR